MTFDEDTAARAVDLEQYAATRRWMRRERIKTPFRRVWHRLLRHEVGRYACFTCDMDLPALW